jgi:hypothetical protein
MKYAAFLLAAVSLLATDDRGLRPRPSADDYPASTVEKGTVLAAEVIDPEHVRKDFASPIYAHYLVIEVALYPSAGQDMNLSNGDFVLRLKNSGSLLRPTSPAAVAAALNRRSNAPPSKPSDVTLYPTADIGYSSGADYDPVTGQRRPGGWRTGTGVGVGIGNPGPKQQPPASTDKDRHTMETELTEKGLPDGLTTKPVCGYLYFPIPSGAKRIVPEELQYLGDSGSIKLPLPQRPIKK